MKNIYIVEIFEKSISPEFDGTEAQPIRLVASEFLNKVNLSKGDELDPYQEYLVRITGGDLVPYRFAEDNAGNPRILTVVEREQRINSSRSDHYGSIFRMDPEADTIFYIEQPTRRGNTSQMVTGIYERIGPQRISQVENLTLAVGDPELRSRIVGHMQNGFCAEIVETIDAVNLDSNRWLTYELVPLDLNGALREHRIIVSALMNYDSEMGDEIYRVGQVVNGKGHICRYEGANRFIMMDKNTRYYIKQIY